MTIRQFQKEDGVLAYCPECKKEVTINEVVTAGKEKLSHTECGTDLFCAPPLAFQAIKEEFKKKGHWNDGD